MSCRQNVCKKKALYPSKTVFVALAKTPATTL